MINLISSIVISICVFAMFVAILINFVERKQKVAKQKRSVVETGSMTVFFILFYLLLRFKIGAVIVPTALYYFLIPIGLIIIVFGCYVNIKGRFALGQNWANQVTIYEHQQLVQSGMYRFVRHPLYASIIWMFYGACLVYPNYLAFLSNSFIFVPFMIMRAKQEEKLLTEQFSGYEQYKKQTGMFFPKLFYRKHKNL